METKSYHNLEKTKTTNFMVGALLISSVVLATLSYGITEPIKKRYRTTSLDNTSLLVDASEKPPVIELPKQQPQTQQQSTQKDETIDLNNDIKQSDSPFTPDNKQSVDLGLPKGDSTVIVNVDPIPVVTPDKIEEFPDVEAEFIGGYSAWKEYLLNELKYPDYSLEVGDEGCVYLSFVVETDGSIGDVKVTKGVSFEIDKEAKRVIKNSPKWKPGKTSNKLVRTRITIPINFVIN